MGAPAEQAKQPVKGPGIDARPLPAWALFARNVEQLTLDDARFSLRSPDLRPAILTERVFNLQTNSVTFAKPQ